MIEIIFNYKERIKFENFVGCNMPSNHKNKKATAMLAVLIMVFIGGIIASRVTPSYEIQIQRQNTHDLKFALMQLRQAFELKTLKDPDWIRNSNKDVNKASDVYDLIYEILVKQEKLIGNVPNDNTIPKYQWFRNPELHPSVAFFWTITGNIASNTNFETFNFENELPPWNFTPDSKISTATVLFPSFLDDYDGQNKFGKPLSKKNTVLVITK